MADFTQTIENSINVFGPADTNKWNAITWGTHNWGYGDDDLQTSIFKVLDSGTITLTNEIEKSVGFIRTFSQSMTVTGDMTFEGLTDNAGYSKLDKGVSNYEDRYFPEYTEATRPDATYTAGTGNSTSWSKQ